MKDLCHVAVIGAGWAGLSAAASLANRGIRATVLEASRNLGGRARRVSIDGVDLDNGQHILIGAYRESLALIRMVGVDPARAFMRLPLELRFADGFHLRAPKLPYPFNLLAALLGANGLSTAQGLAATRFMFGLQMRRFRVDPDRSVSALLEAHGQSGPLRRYLWEPLCVSALNTPADHASAQVFANVLRDGLTGSRENSDLLLPRANLGRIFPEPAAAFVESRGGQVLLGEAVRRIARKDGGFRLDDRAQPYSHVILACAPQHAAPLIADFPELAEHAAAISALRYEPIYTCYLRYAQVPSLPSAMVGLPGPIGQWVFDRSVLSGEQSLLAVIVSASGAHQDLPQDELAARIHGELERSLPGLGKPLWSRVIGEKRATFSCTPSLGRPIAATSIPGFLLAGDYVASDYPGTLEAAVRSGIAAANRIAGAEPGRGAGRPA